MLRRGLTAGVGRGHGARAFLAVMTTLAVAGLTAAGVPPAAGVPGIPALPPGQVFVERVRVEGTRAILESEALRLLGVRAGTGCDTLALVAGVRRLMDACAAEGLLDARVELSWRAVAATAFELTVRIAEGEPWLVGEIRHAGALPAVLARTADRASRRPGVRYRTADLEADLERTLAAYDEAGYPWARLRPGRLDLAGGRVSLTVTHEPGPLVTLEAVELAGVQHTRPRIAERAMGFARGRPYCQSRLVAGVERLRGSGLFAGVGEAYLVPGVDPAVSRLRIPVREAPVGSVSGILGYSGADRRLAGDLDFRLHNIAGTGRQGRARWSSRQQASTLYLLSYREPWLLGLPLDLSLDLEHVLFDTLYTRTRTDAALAWRVGSRLVVLAGAGRDRAVITSTVRRSAGSYRLRAGLYYDGRDSRLAPTRGLQAGLEAERGKTLAGLYGDQAGSELAALTRTALRGELHRPVSRTAVAALFLTARTLDTRARPVPQYELFPLGGATTLRGYREEQFYTPGYLLAQFEYRLGMAAHGTGVHLFVDTAVFSAGGASARWWPRTTESKTGYGAGVRVGSRMGRVGVEYGLAAGEGPLDGRIHLRVEAEF